MENLELAAKVWVVVTVFVFFFKFRKNKVENNKKTQEKQKIENKQHSILSEASRIQWDKTKNSNNKLRRKTTIKTNWSHFISNDKSKKFLQQQEEEDWKQQEEEEQQQEEEEQQQEEEEEQQQQEEEEQQQEEQENQETSQLNARALQDVQAQFCNLKNKKWMG